MKKYILSLLVPFITLLSCSEDNSAYQPQEKEDIKVDQIIIEDDNGNEVPSDGTLVPGLHLAKVMITQPDGQEVERKFKYYVPISLDATKSISLIFEFHGSWTYESEHAPDPIADISLTHPWIQHAIQENCVIVFPAGEAVGSAVNWQNSENHLPFVDRMVDYFVNAKPAIDAKRIYSSGQSSGAIFSFVLAFHRSEIFASVAPRAGQMSITSQTEMPSRAVPIRLFAGMDDNTVLHSAALNNMIIWAERIGGYFAKDMELTADGVIIEGYSDVTTRKWSGARTDLEMYSLKGIGHGVNLAKCVPYIWEFWETHTLESETNNLYLNTEFDTITPNCGQKINIKISAPQGTTLNILGAPFGWETSLNGNTLSLTAPKREDFYGDIDRNGTIKVTGSFNGKEKSNNIIYRLQAPKTFYEVGDIYYNANSEAVGVVFYVPRNNIKKALIVNLQEVTTQGSYQTIKFGSFGDFYTPDENNGKTNTQAYVERNISENLKLTNATSGLIWAATYEYLGEQGWHLPAVNQWGYLNSNLELVNNILSQIGGDKIIMNTEANSDYLSSTVVNKNATKIFMNFNFYKRAIKEQNASSDNTGWSRARAIKEVSLD